MVAKKSAVKDVKVEEAVATVAPMMELPNLHKHCPIVQDGLNIIQIGVGGTGGTVAMNILKMMGGLAKDIAERVNFVAIDGDEFEEKNLGRQLCITPDLGKNKAEVIVGRYANAFGITNDKASFIDEYIKGPDEVFELMNPGYTNIIIDNLDKNRPRNWLHDAVKKFVATYRIAYVYEISTGNGEWGGQVSMGCVHKVDNKIIRHEPGRTALGEPYYFSIPSPYVVHPELLDTTVDDREEAMSCADRAAANVQSLVANNTAATLCFNYVNAIVHQFVSQIEGYPDVEQLYGSVSFNSKNNGFTGAKFTDAYLGRDLL